MRGPSSHKLGEQIRRRAKHEPLAYIRGKTEFYGREYFVNSHTLEPRPESETMVVLLKETLNNKRFLVECPNTPSKNIPPHNSSAYNTYKVAPCNFTTPLSSHKVAPCKYCGVAGGVLTVVDVGTGCGALGITAKMEFPDIEVILTDIDATCLKTARQNATNHKVNVTFSRGNLLQPLLHSQPGFTYVEPGDVFSLSSEIKRIDDTLHEQRKGKTSPGPQANSRVASSDRKQAVGDTWILLANLPYVPDAHTINQAAMFEPKHAIFGGPDGLDLYREMFSQIKLSENKPCLIFTESLPFQHEDLSKIARNCEYKLTKTHDFIQVFINS